MKMNRNVAMVAMSNVTLISASDDYFSLRYLSEIKAIIRLYFVNSMTWEAQNNMPFDFLEEMSTH